jgi:hypothetical protein
MLQSLTLVPHALKSATGRDIIETCDFRLWLEARN